MTTKLLLLIVFVFPVFPQNSGSGSNTAVNSSDLGYRIGSIEAKIENQTKTLDELKAEVKQANASLALVSLDTKRIADRTSAIMTFLVIVFTALVGNLVALWFKTFSPKDPPPGPMMYGVDLHAASGAGFVRRFGEPLAGEEQERERR